ncbi:hypothetical protein P3L10_025852 [Capsicum annuum]
MAFAFLLQGHGNGRRKKGKRGPNNLPAGQYTTPTPPLVTTTLQPATTNILPLPRETISLPNAFFMPPPPHLFHHSSLYNSLHSSSSSVPSTSSTPSLSGLRIGGPSISTSPSINSVTTSNAIASASQILKFKEVVEYDGNGRLIITPDGNGFIAAYSDGHMVIEVIKLFYTEPLGSWNEIRFDVRILMWNQFMAKCAWNSCHENEIQCIFKLKAALRIKEHLYEAQRNLEKPGWLSADVWVQFLEKWDTPKYRAGRERAKANRASQTGGSLHTGGSISFAMHRRRLVILA